MEISSQILSSLSFLIQRLIEVGSYPGLLLFMIVASLNIPIPSEIAYAFSGFLSSQNSFYLPWVIIAGALGNVFGASVNYFIGSHYREKHGSRPDFGFIKTEDLSRAQAWFSRWGNLGVFLGHLTPGLRAFIGFPAGFLGINFNKFIVLTVPATLIWATLWVSLGYTLGVEWERISVYTRKLDILILILILVAGIWWIKKHFFTKKYDY